ncbi:MAG: hypothetical protein MZU95_00670 [Desulfomicrobium escambiense]|nr:hypothetical protein [Desulfomicrobium escambiense]
MKNSMGVTTEIICSAVTRRFPVSDRYRSLRSKTFAGFSQEFASAGTGLPCLNIAMSAHPPA